MIEKSVKLQEEVVLASKRSQAKIASIQKEEGTAGTTFGQIFDDKQTNAFKWTDEEHARYVYFLQANKLKIKSKLIRKSNAFFREMAAYIPSKTALQCRSHHQKFEQRYRFPHRIITAQKKHISPEIYAKLTNEMNSAANAAHCIRCTHNAAKKFVSVECQTDQPTPVATPQAAWAQDGWRGSFPMHGGYNPFPYYPNPYYMM